MAHKDAETLLANITPGALVSVTWGSGSDGRALVEARSDNLVALRPPPGCSAGNITITDRRSGVLSAPVNGVTLDGMLTIDLDRCTFQQRREYFRVDVELPLATRWLGEAGIDQARASWRTAADSGGLGKACRSRLSLSGGGFGADIGPLPVGSLLLAELQLADVSALALGRVVRVAGTYCGVEFLAVSERDRAAIIRTVNGVDLERRRASVI